MTDLGTTLIPLAIATAVLPIQITVTLLLLRSDGSRASGFAWVLGLAAVRLVQYALFGFVLEQAVGDSTSGPSPVEGALLLVVAVLLYVSAARKLAHQPDEDAPPPRWMTMLDDASPRMAFAMAAGIVAFSPKLWAFTLGAIGAIGESDLGVAGGWLAYLVWLVAALSIHLIAVLAVVLAPGRAGPLLGRAGATLEARGRSLMIGVGLVFGTWFLVKALVSFGFGPGS
jgi:hypothetical protein